MPPEEIRRLTNRYAAPLEVAPHVAGAAVDLRLIDGEGRKLQMGTALDSPPEEARDAQAFDAPGISALARQHRSLLAEVLTNAGLVNYPTEWWHWSFGDRYWAFVTGATFASYGPIPRRWTR